MKQKTTLPEWVLLEKVSCEHQQCKKRLDSLSELSTARYFTGNIKPYLVRFVFQE